MSTDPAAMPAAPESIVIPHTTVRPVPDFATAEVSEPIAAVSVAAVSVPGASPVATMAEPAVAPAPPPEPFDPYKRRIFRYEHDGATIAVDPMATYRKFVKALRDAGEDDIDALFANAFKSLDARHDDGTPEYTAAEQDAVLWNLIDPARQTIIAAIRSAFGYGEIQADGTGMGEGEALNLFTAFWTMQDDVKKSTEMTPNS